MTTRRLTRPGLSDNEFMTVTCTPDKTTVEFTEFQDEAEIIALENLHPTTTTYVGKVLKQGQHKIRGSSKHIAIVVEVDAELAKAIRHHNGGRNRAAFAQLMDSLLAADLEQIRSEYRDAQSGVFGRAAQIAVEMRQDEKTQPGLTPECPGPNCPMCSGAMCNKCGAGCWSNSAPRCDHATDERHESAGRGRR